MRFTSANSRNQLRERQRRDRATAQVMRALYPQFASLKLEFDFSEPDPDASAPAPHLLVMHPPSQAYFVFPCPYADCDGEFDLGSVTNSFSVPNVTGTAQYNITSTRDITDPLVRVGLNYRFSAVR